MILRSKCCAVLMLVLAFGFPSYSQAGEPAPLPAEAALLHRLESAESRIRELETQQTEPRHISQGQPLDDPLPEESRRESLIRPAFFQVMERPEAYTNNDYEVSPLFPFESPLPPRSAEPASEKQKFEVGYDHGTFLRPTAAYEDKIPFELKATTRLDFRHVGMVSNNPALPSRNYFEIERGRLKFEGHAFSPKLHYEIQLRFDNDAATNVRLFDYYVRYELNKAFGVMVGQAKVPFARAWLQSSSRLQLSDRSMASNFFMPQRSQGVWFSGEPAHQLYYQFAVLNGFDTTTLTPAQIDANFAYSGTAFWDPLADYGAGFSDLQNHEDLAIRVGGGGLFTDIAARSQQLRLIRLVDSGNRFSNVYPGAGVKLSELSADAALKYRGFSLFHESYFRWLEDIGAANAPSSIYDWGFDTQLGYFLIPKTFEFFARQSRIIHAGGSPSADEYAAGCNWFFDGHYAKLTFDVNTYNGNPSVSSSLDLRQGENGVLFRTQLQLIF